MTSLDNRQYFPCFDELPLMDEYMDPQYYQDIGGGTMLPLKHWCYIAEIMDDSLSHMPDFFHRVEVRDLTGHCNSVLFSPEQGLDYASLRRGATLFVRYAAKAYFSDLMTQVIKVDDCSYVKVIPRGLDDLLLLSHWYFAGRAACSACRAPLGGGPAAQCSACEAAQYCSGECMARHAGEHEQHCGLCRQLMDVINVDMDRFIQPVPFR
uniref:MYND-type domain-containing protein n=2 Tax=Tetradesmus obliquus TaxID=3088 RepID=A0A383WCC0_TETOB|eukprot:jgi/Sobl393_1/134/SZX74873.1